MAGEILGPAPACPSGCGRAARWYGHGRGFDCQACATAAADRRRARTRRTASVRNPPRPPFERVAGACSLCGLSPLPGRRRSWCSDACVDLWMLATNSRRALGQLVALHGHECWRCGTRTVEETRPGFPTLGIPPEVVEVPVPLAVDHVRPLWLLTVEEATELRWWLPFNLQLLCDRCHGAKTKREAALRARLRRDHPERLR